VLDRVYAFAGNAFPREINGSLWTIGPELRCYGLVAALGLTGLLARRKVLPLCLVIAYAMYAYYVCRRGVAAQEGAMCRLILYFFLGATAARFGFAVLRPTLARTVLAVAVLAIAARAGGFALVLPLAGGYLLSTLAFGRPAPAIPGLAGIDLSYGIFLYAFPIQQLLVASGVRSPLTLFIAALPATLICACASWFLVESPILRKKDKLLVR